MWNLPIACNRATADFLITSPLLATDYERDVPNYGERYDESYGDDRGWDDLARKVAIA